MVFDRSKIIYPPLRQENRRAGEPEEEFTTEAQRIQREERESQKEDSPQNFTELYLLFWSGFQPSLE